MNKSFIPLSVPNLKGNELKYVTHAVETEWVSTAGPYVSDFEESVAKYIHAPSAVSCQSGTAGIHVALRLLGVGPGDIVIAPTLTFIAAVNPICYLGAEPVLMDCDDSLCIDPVKVREFCEKECDFEDAKLVHRASGRIVRAMTVVHVFGNMADMSALLDIARDYNIKVLEDATEAIGTYYTEGALAGKYAGTMGDMGVFSFNGNKIITTGGGGMIVSNDEELLAKAKHLTTQAKSDTLYFEHDEIGYNYRLTNLQAALGLAQMEELEGFIATKTKNWQLYAELLKDIDGLELLPYRADIRSNHWFYALVCDPKKFNRDHIIHNLSEKHNIQTRPIWGLISDQKPYADVLTYKIERAAWYHDRVVNIPCSSNLAEKQVRTVVEALLSEAGR